MSFAITKKRLSATISFHSLIFVLLIAISLLFSQQSLAAGSCPASPSTDAAGHVSAGRATSSGSPSCSSCSNKSCCQSYGADGYFNSFYGCYDGNYWVSHSCWNASGVTYTSTGGSTISDSGSYVLYQGSNGLWYSSNPNDCGTDTDGDGVNDDVDAFPNDPNETTDTDGDGVGDNADDFPNDASETTDTDGDGVGDNSDAFPNDSSETADSDGDGVGDIADDFPNDASETVDTDADGVGDNSDAFPNDDSETTDTDGDGVGDNADAFPNDNSETTDTDGDGVGDNSDAFPNDGSETVDTDGDGVGDNADAFPNNGSETVDTDGDGVGDNSDAFPNDGSETLDTDGDGVGDNADAFPNDGSETVDTDGDGVGNNADAFPNDGSETIDTDGDGVGDNADAFPNNGSETTDSDGDGVGDNSDAFPNDATETVDSDGDGVGDNSDAFPNNASETVDTDGDGVGDNADDFPDDPTKSADVDTDGDGVSDSKDAFPNDPNETADTDGDGVGDNADAFPSDPNETIDSDGDGIGDNSDAFPNNPTETVDSDGDGVGNNADAFPNDATETVDSDGDGVGDNSDAFPTDGTETADTDGDGTGDNADEFPTNPNETTDTDGDGTGDNADEFPTNPNETTDTDGDGTGDNADEFPTNPNEITDTDGDGTGDNADEFPNDANEITDTDGDGTGDNADEFPNDATETIDTDKDGTGDNADEFPNDPNETTDTDKDGVGDNADEFPTDPTKSSSTVTFNLEVTPDGGGDVHGEFNDGGSTTLSAISIDSGDTATFTVEATTTGYQIGTVESNDTDNCIVEESSVGDAFSREYKITSVSSSCTTITATFIPAVFNSWRDLTTTTSSGSGSSALGSDVVKPNIMLQMDDSFLMNTEVMWTSASGNSEFINWSNAGQMFINPRASETSNTTYVDDSGNLLGYGKGATMEALYSGYNSLAFNPEIDYKPWPGIDPTTGEAYADREFVCSHISVLDAGDSTNENKYCAKYFPEFKNNLKGGGCGDLNDNAPTSSTKYCVLKDCQNGIQGGLHGCKEFVALDPDTEHNEFGQFTDYIDDADACRYSVSYRTGNGALGASSSTFCNSVGKCNLGGSLNQCLNYDAMTYFYPLSIDGVINNHRYAPNATIEHVACVQGYMGIDSGGASDVCDAIKGMTFAATDPVTGKIVVNFDPQSYTCAVLNASGQSHCQVGGKGYTTRKYTNILRKYDLVTHRYTVKESGVLKSKALSQQSAEIQQRYANWFTYYRTRGHVQKAAMLRFVNASSSERIGLASNLYKSYDPSTQWIFDSSKPGNILPPEKMDVSANKTALMTAIARANTPFAVPASPVDSLNENITLNGNREISEFYKGNIDYQYESPSDTNHPSKNCRQNHIVLFTTNNWSGTEPTESKTGAITTAPSLSNLSNTYYDTDLFPGLEDKVPTTGSYSTNQSQHVKTWVAYLGSEGAVAEASRNLNPAFSTIDTAIANLTDADKINDLAKSAVTSKGGYYRAETIADIINLFDTPGASNDLLDWINSLNESDYNNCGVVSTQFIGKRISWKELSRY